MKRKINPLCCANCDSNKKLLRLAEARADDATRQYNAEHEDAMLLSNELTRTLTLYKKLLKEDGWDELAAELNMEAYESAQLHAKTNHTLLTEARADIDRLKAEISERDADDHLANEHTAKMLELYERDLAHSDAQRRMLERDNGWQNEKLIEQQAQLAIYAPFKRVLASFPAKEIQA